MSDVIMLNNVRLAFPALDKPKAFSPQDPPKYSADLLLDPAVNKADWDRFQAAVQEVANQKWGENAAYVIQEVQGDRNKCCYGNGNDRRKQDLSVLDGYAGMLYVSAKSANKPALVSQQGAELTPLEVQSGQGTMPYPGCYVNALVRPWPQDNQWGRGIRAELLGVQFLRDGERFGPGSVDAGSYFKPVEGAPPPVTGGGNGGGAPWL